MTTGLDRQRERDAFNRTIMNLNAQLAAAQEEVKRLNDAHEVAWHETVSAYNEKLARLREERNAVLQRAERAEEERDGLNRLLHEVGWGQGEIDSSATIAEENERLREERDTLAAAIATPEVYAGVVSAVLEAERDAAVKECTRLREERDGLRAAFTELAERWNMRAFLVKGGSGMEAAFLECEREACAALAKHKGG